MIIPDVQASMQGHKYEGSKIAWGFQNFFKNGSWELAPEVKKKLHEMPETVYQKVVVRKLNARG